MTYSPSTAPIACLKRLPKIVSLPWLGVIEKLVACLVVLVSLLIVKSGDLQLLGAFCYICAISFGGFVWFKSTAIDRTEASFLPNLFLLSFGVRAAAAVAIQMFVKGYVAYDAPTYEGYGLQWSAFWNKLTVSPPHEYIENLHLYSQIIGVQYLLSGNNGYIPQLTNSLIGALVPTLVYRMGRQILGAETPGRVAGIFATFNTACIIWSAIAMRDIIIIFFMTVALSDLLKMLNKLSVIGVIRLIVSLSVIYIFRPYAALIMICVIGITFSITLAKKPLIRFAIGALFAGLLVGVVVIGGVRAIALEIIQSQTTQINDARSIITYQNSHDQGYAPDVKYETPIDLVKFIPAGLFYFLAGPLPIGYGARQFLFSIPEIISWYITIWYGFRGFVYLRGRSLAIIPLAIYFLLGSFLLSAICGNYAEAIRLRSMLAVPLQLMAGAGWVHRRNRLLSTTATP